MSNVWLMCCLVQAETLRKVCLVQGPHTTLTSLLESTFSRWALSQSLPKRLSEGRAMCPWLLSDSRGSCSLLLMTVQRVLYMTHQQVEGQSLRGNGLPMLMCCQQF